jgi:Domain of unknown function (DUF4372)
LVGIFGEIGVLGLMNQGRTVFSQLISFLPDREFRRCVERYQGDLRLRGLTCWDQYLAMAFAQLTYRESPRDIEACLRISRVIFQEDASGKVAFDAAPCAWRRRFRLDRCSTRS